MNIVILEMIDPITLKTKFFLQDQETQMFFKGNFDTGHWEKDTKGVKLFSTKRLAEFAQNHFENLHAKLISEQSGVHYLDSAKERKRIQAIVDLPLFTSHNLSYVNKK